MQKYDVVLLLDASLSETNRKEVIVEFGKLIKKHLIQEDDMGLQQLAYDLGKKTGNDKAYVYSYCIEAEAEDLDKIKKNVLYNKAIKRYFVFKMGKSDEFFIFKKVNEDLNAIIDTWDIKKLGQKVTFFADKRNHKYINWKSIRMLKKYINRFGDIKPREYTHNAVSTQKKLKMIILRARELGFLEYKK